MSNALTIYSNVHPTVRPNVIEYMPVMRYRVGLMIGFVLSWVVSLAALYGTFGAAIQAVTVVLTAFQIGTLVMLYRMGVLPLVTRFWLAVFRGR
ncbi:hypothetical protein [Azospirillum sp. sgz301742]